MIDSNVPTILIEAAIRLWVSESSARGNIVTKATKNVPAIAITRGNRLFAFSTGSSLIRNKTVIRPMNATVEAREQTSTMNFTEVGSLVL